MWNIAGDAADNDPAVLIAHKDELLGICDKIIDGCTDENIRLGTWNMRAKFCTLKENRRGTEYI